jgi:DME family drug/metabolite transporter
MRAALRDAWAGTGQLSYRDGALLLATSGVVLSFTAVVFRGLDEATDWQFLTIRGLSAAAAMVSLALLRRRTRPVDLRSVSRTTAVAACLLTAMSVLFILALARTTTATVTFLIAAGPLSGAAFGRLVLGERLSKATVAAMTVAATGIAIMAAGGLSGGSTTGFVLAAMIPVLLGLYNVLIRSMPDLDPLIPAFWSTLLLGVVSGSIALSTDGLSMPWRDVGLGIVSGFIIMGIGLPLFNLGHRAVPTAQISLLIMTELVLAPIWVWIWPGETPSTSTLIGGVIVMAAVAGQVIAGRESNDSPASRSATSPTMQSEDAHT